MTNSLDIPLHLLRNMQSYNIQIEMEVIIGAFIDFSKAFDTVDHKILIKNLKNME